jgi:hypothetical protein
MFMTAPTLRGAAAVLAAAVLAAAGLALAGCAPKPDPSAQAAAPQPAIAQPHPAPEATQPAPAPDATASQGTAEALALKAQNYARELEAIVAKRGAARPEPSPSALVNPDDFRIGPAPSKRPEPPVQVVPIAETVVNNTPSMPNQTATLVTPEKPAAVASATANANHVFADSPPERATAPRPAAPKESGPSAGDLDGTMSKNLRDYPRDVWANLDFQLLEFLKDKPTPRLDALAKLSAEDRELIAAVLDGLTNFRNGVRSDNNMLMSRKVRPLLDLADRLRAQADLVIPTLSLCTRVDGFGVYEPVDAARFTAMREHPVIVYCEVENFSSILTEKKQWETRLSQEVVLYTETGLPIWKDKTENIPDLARNRRHDFFVVKKTKFPGNIAVGRYLLKVTIVDQQASRVAEATIPVQFVAQ